MQPETRYQVAKIALLVVLGVLLVIDIVQHDALESRMADAQRRLRDLSEAQARMAKALEQGVLSTPSGATAVPPSPAAAPPADLRVAEGRSFLAPLDRAGHDPRLDGGTIQRYFGPDPKGFNPITENAADTSDLYEYITEPLASRRLDAPDVWEGRLAESCVISDDYKTYTFKLRRGLLWHAPTVDLDAPQHAWLEGDHPVTAHDVKFTLDLVLNPQVEAGFLKSYFEDCAGSEVLDDHTVVIRWKKKTYVSIDATLYLAPIPRFLYSCDEHGRPFPAESLGTSFNSHWYNDKAIGFGPYRFVEWKPGVHIRLKRNPAYYGRPAHIEEIVWQIIRDPETTLNRLKVGELDYAGLYPGQYKREVLDAKPGSPFHPDSRKILHDKYLRFSYYFIGWNMSRPIFADRRVRLAMTHAFPKEKILQHIFSGLGEITGSPFYLKSPATDPAIQPWPCDPGAARRLLAEAGWKDSDGDGILDRVRDGKKEDFEFQLVLYAHSQEYRDLGNIFKEELLKIGVRMTPLSVDWAQMQKKMDDKDFDAYTGGWGLSWDSDPFQIWHSSQADVPKGSNRVGLRNPEVDRLIETLRVTFDDAQRVAMQRRIHAIIHEEQPYTFFYTPLVVPAWYPHVKGVRFFVIRPQAFGVGWHLQRP